MTDAILENFIRKYIQAQPSGVAEVNFAWQGGEPTLMKIAFFHKVVDLQAKYSPAGMVVTNALQTNGTLLNDEWGKILKEHDFLVGISIDGPEKLHDRYRTDKRGNGSFKDVMRGLEILKKYDIRFNTLTVLQSNNADYPDEVYAFLKHIGSTFWQFIPIVEPEGEQKVSPRTVAPAQFGKFICRIFDLWLQGRDVGNIFIQYFDMMLMIVLGYPSSLCVHSKTCGRAVALEHDGTVYSCDHYVEPEYRLGNLDQSVLADMLDGERQTAFGNNKFDILPRYCRRCAYLCFCYGACPKDRISLTPDGFPGLNYLCKGYKKSYAHLLPVLAKMAECIQQGRPACEYNRPFAALPACAGEKPKRNALCPCGSGLKYKKCCGMPRWGR